MAARARARLVDPGRLGQALFARCPPLLVATEQPDLGTSIDQRRTAADVQIRRLSEVHLGEALVGRGFATWACSGRKARGRSKPKSSIDKGD
jgi:hypothetical protein